MEHNNISQNQYIQEDEIDLKELFKTIANKKKFIFIFTITITLLATIYSLTKTPVYEAKSVIRIGNIGNTLLDTPEAIVAKLSILFDIDNKNIKSGEIVEAKITNINIDKKAKDFLTVTSEALSNDLATIENKRVIQYLQKEYQSKIDEYKYVVQKTLNNEKYKKEYIKNVELKNIQLQIDKIKTQTLPKIDEKINILKNQDIFMIDEEIKFLKNVKLRSIENKIKYYSNKIDENEKLIKELISKKITNNTEGVIVSTQISSYQTFLLTSQNSLENLYIEKQNILTKDIPSLELKKKNIINVSIKDLETQKENIKKENIKNLEIKRDIEIPNKIRVLDENIKLEALKISQNNINNFSLIGEIITNEHPIKPKKKLIVVVAFITGLILSIFIVFFMQFISNMKEEKNGN